jgi:Carbonic anhydrases/acetyltransferases, isoleucine patch superfamily
MVDHIWTMPVESFNGNSPKIAESAYVHPLAYVIGRVEIGELTGVWPFASLRGDNGSIRLGRRSNVQEGCAVHTDPGYEVVIGDRVSVGHNAVIHGSRIESNVIIGMGAILLNGSKVEEYCIIGAGALVTENTTIPSYSVAVGIPARVMRRVTEEEIKAIERNAESYVAKLQSLRDRP